MGREPLTQCSVNVNGGSFPQHPILQIRMYHGVGQVPGTCPSLKLGRFWLCSRYPFLSSLKRFKFSLPWSSPGHRPWLLSQAYWILSLWPTPPALSWSVGCSFSSHILLHTCCAFPSLPKCTLCGDSHTAGAPFFPTYPWPMSPGCSWPCPNFFFMNILSSCLTRPLLKLISFLF